jgi:spore coat polysaccharide biosynthesis protein SpsF
MSQQGDLWEGEFGRQYTARNSPTVMSTRAFFRRALKNADQTPKAVLEFGANKGHNLLAIEHVTNITSTYGVEINPQAAEILEANASVVFQMDALNFDITGLVDLVVSKGFLIHINPADLWRMYEIMYNASTRYILIAEYHAATCTPVAYRNLEGYLWRNDFAGQMLNQFNGKLELVDYGFVYHLASRAQADTQDDVTWFLMEKSDGLKRDGSD